MKKSLLCAVAAVSLAASGAFAQTDTKTPAGGGEAPKGGEMKLPAGAPAGTKPAGAAPAEKMEPAGAPKAQMKPAGEPTEPQASGEQKAEPKSKAAPAGETTKPGAATGQKAGESKAGAQKAGEPNSAQPAAKTGAARPAPKLSGEQQTKVRTAVEQIHVQPVHVDFNVRIGVAIPRTVELRPLPPEIITIVPEYEYYRFFVVPGEIIIVDPDTLDIVAILPL